jgi:spore coat protein H
MKAEAVAETTSRHQATSKAFKLRFLICFLILLVIAFRVCAQNKATVATPASSSKLPVYELKMEPRDLAKLDADPSSNETHPATFIADGVTYEKVHVRYRGDWARSWPKKPLKIFFNEDKPFQGHHSVNLNSAWRDASFLRETLAYQVYNTCGVPASRSRVVRLNLNGQFRGLYVEVEQVDKAFLKRVQLKGAALYKAHSSENWADERDLGRLASYTNHYEPETQKNETHADLQQFCQALSRSTNALEFFTNHVDLEKYINFLAVTAFVQNWDCFNKNHYLLHDLKGSKKWVVVPWDLDRTFGDIWFGRAIGAELPILQGTKSFPGPTGWNRMMEKFFSDSTLRERFAKRLQQLLETELTTEKLFPVLDRFEAEANAEAAQDRKRWRGSPLSLQKGIDQLKNYIERRRNFLAKDLENFRKRTGAAKQ